MSFESVDMDTNLRKITLSCWAVWGSQAIIGAAFIALGYALWTGAIPMSSIPNLFAEPSFTRMFIAGYCFLCGAVGIIGFLVYFPIVLKQLSKARENLPRKKWAKAQLRYTSPFPVCLISRMTDAGETGDVSAVVVHCVNPWEPLLKAALQPGAGLDETVDVMFDGSSKSPILINQDDELQLVIVNLPAPLSQLIQTLNGSMLQAAKQARR